MSGTATRNTPEYVLGQLEESIRLFREYAGRNYTTPFDEGLHVRIARLEVLAAEFERQLTENAS